MADQDSSDTSSDHLESGAEDYQEDTDTKGTTIEDARFQMRTTKHAEEIVRELAHEDYQRPSEMIPSVKDRTDISRSNFYNLLGKIEGSLVEKVEGPGRATLYTLTDIGETVADEFGLTPATEPTEQTGAVINIAEESATDAIWKIMKYKNLTSDDLSDLVLPKLRTREQDTSDRSETVDQSPAPERRPER